MTDLEVDPDIRSARTLPPAIDGSALYERSLDRVFSRTWHVVDEGGATLERQSARPLVLLPGCLDEPLAITRGSDGEASLLSNVCTHRANLVVAAPCKTASLRCGYHGRRFRLDGGFVSMPEFEGALGFPSAGDDLPRVPMGTWGPLRFASLHPEHDLADLLAPLDRLASLPALEGLVEGSPATDVRDYEVGAHWALYVENYLEGLHVPFVHAGLNEALDFGAYRTELSRLGTLQIGIAKPGEPTLDLPIGHPDLGQRVAAYYLWLFPGTMINVYPWGLSVNVVRPQGPERTTVTFASFVTDEAKRELGAGADLHRVEMEDEAVVQQVQRGVRSRLYRGGRFSPTRETGVHHFHRLLAAHLAG